MAEGDGGSAESREHPEAPEIEPQEAQEGEEGEDTEETEDKDGEDPKEGEDGADGKKKKKEKKEKKAKVVKDEKMGQVKHEDLDWIWIGGADDARDREALEKAKIRYVLNCTPVRSNGGVANFYEKEPSMRMEYCRVSMGDNATETLQSRMEASWVFLEKARIREDGSVLIHCQQGVSRSVSMAMSYMMKYYRKSFDEAMAICKEARSQACPNEGFTAQLKAFDEELKSNPKLYEPMPPKRGKMYLTNGRSQGPSVGARGPVGPVGPRGPVGPGPARGPAGPPRGPVGPSVGPAVGPAVGPTVGPAVGPAVGPVGPEKRKAEKVGPTKPGVAGPPKMKKPKA